MIKIGWWSEWWVGECFFWYRLTWVILDKGHKTVVVLLWIIDFLSFLSSTVLAFRFYLMKLFIESRTATWCRVDECTNMMAMAAEWCQSLVQWKSGGYHTTPSWWFAALYNICDLSTLLRDFVIRPKYMGRLDGPIWWVFMLAVRNSCWHDLTLWTLWGQVLRPWPSYWCMLACVSWNCW